MTPAVDPSNPAVLYDTKRVPLWLRLPCLLLALLCLAMAIDLIALPVVGHTLLLPPPGQLPLRWLPAVVGTSLLAALLLQVWLGRKRIVWEAECGQLLLEDPWLLGTWLAQEQFQALNERRVNAVADHVEHAALVAGGVEEARDGKVIAAASDDGDRSMIRREETSACVQVTV